MSDDQHTKLLAMARAYGDRTRRRNAQLTFGSIIGMTITLDNGFIAQIWGSWIGGRP